MDEQTRTYREGDLIRATKGDTVLTGRLVKGTVLDGGFILFDAGWSIKSFELQGWVIEVLEPAPIPLPTEPGLYRDREGDLWTLRNRTWYLDDNILPVTKPEDCIPFTRLYTKEEVMVKTRHAAYKADPTYGYGGDLVTMIDVLEETL